MHHECGEFHRHLGSHEDRDAARGRERGVVVVVVVRRGGNREDRERERGVVGVGGGVGRGGGVPEEFQL